MLTYGKYFYHIQHKPPDLSDIRAEVDNILNPKASKIENPIKTKDGLDKASINHFSHENNLQTNESNDFNKENQKSTNNIQENNKSLDTSEKSLHPQTIKKNKLKLITQIII